MRHARFVLHGESAPLDIVNRLAGPDDDVHPEAILHLNHLADGTGVVLYTVRGDPDHLRTLLDGDEHALSYHLFNVDAQPFNVHIHFEPRDVVASLLAVAEKRRLTIIPPVEFVGRNGLRVEVAGRHEDIQAAADVVPEDVSFTLEQTGNYDPDHQTLGHLLTERQREVLETAAELGYYDVPRRATQSDVAAELGCSAGTVGEHLRKIHATIVSELV